MGEEEKKCPMCKGKMEAGELVDESYAVSVAQKWAKQAGSILGLGKSKGIEIISYRCIECGYLENYASDKKKMVPNGEGLPFGYDR